MRERAKTKWKIDHNGTPSGKIHPGDEAFIISLPEITADNFLLGSTPIDRNFCRIDPMSRMAMDGAGGGLPRYLGALPPGPAPENGDWFTTLLKKWAAANESMKNSRLSSFMNAGLKLVSLPVST